MMERRGICTRERNLSSEPLGMSSAGCLCGMDREHLGQRRKNSLSRSHLLIRRDEEGMGRGDGEGRREERKSL